MNQRDDSQQAAIEIKKIVQGSPWPSWGLGIVGALIGGAVGSYAYFTLLDYGLDALMLPGVLVGVGFSRGARRPMWSAGVFCAVIGLMAMLFCEWQSLLNFQGGPFLDFIASLDEINTGNKIMLAAGTLIAFWMGKG